MAWEDASTPTKSADNVKGHAAVGPSPATTGVGGPTHVDGSGVPQWFQVETLSVGVDAPVASDVTDTTLTLTWTAVDWNDDDYGALAYQPQVGVDPFAEEDFTDIGDPLAVATVDVTDLTAETEYQFRVVTTTPWGNSVTSDATTVTTEAGE